jgi:L-fucose mutarotase/ribose pyranase (RbsD/FucU family)
MRRPFESKKSRSAGCRCSPAGLAGAALLLALILTGCRTNQPTQSTWRQTLASELPLLGHRNWILVVDSAYPAQTSGGMEVVATGAGQLEVLDAVLQAVDRAAHVSGVIYLDSELAHVPEANAPGIGQYRKTLDQRLQNRRVVRLPHEELIAKLDEAGSAFRILVLKSDLTIPYTSVFVELDCGYWGPEEEQQLRETISRAE